MKFAAAALLLTTVSGQCHIGMVSQVFNDATCTDQTGMQRDVVFDESMIAQTGFCVSKGVGSGFSSIISCDNEG